MNFLFKSCLSNNIVEHKQQIPIHKEMQKDISQYGPLTVDPKAYRFFPTDKQQKSERTKKGSRFFFYGQITHDQYQQRKVKQFHQYVLKHKIQYDMTYFNDQKILLFLQSNHYKPKQTLEGMEKYLAYRKQYLPMPYQKVSQLINKGFFYPTGRDKHFRPILVFNAKLIDWKNVEENLKATVFVQQMIIEKMFLPGQVQSWIVIYDLGGMGLTQMPLGTIKAIASRTSLYFSGRLGKLYMVNAPGSMWLGWKTVSAFLDPVTVDKIKITKSNFQKTLFEIADPSQVQQKYGGTQPNRTQYWPFKIPPGVYDEKRLVSDGQYQKLLKQGKLVNNQIDPRYKK